MSGTKCTVLKACKRALTAAATVLLYGASPVGPVAAQELPLKDINEIPEGQQLKALFPGAALIVITQVVEGEPQELAIIDRDFADEAPWPASIGPKGGGTVETRTDFTISFEFSPGCKCKVMGGSCVWIPSGCNE